MRTLSALYKLYVITWIAEAVTASSEVPEDVMFFTAPNGEFQRQIFSHVKLTDFEEQKLQELREFLESNLEFTMPARYSLDTDERRTALRFLQTFNYEPMPTINAL